MIEKFNIIEVDNPIKWKLDESEFALKYSELYAKFLDKKHNSQDEDKELIYKLFNQDDKKLWEVSKEIPSIEIILKNNSIQNITNLSLYKINGDEVDYITVLSEHNFIYCIVIKAMDQAGTLGIWDVKKNNWCFHFSSELFCVEKIRYDISNNEFIGSYCYQYPMSHFGGSGEFVVTAKRKLEPLKYLNINSEGKKKSGYGKFPFDY